MPRAVCALPYPDEAIPVNGQFGAAAPPRVRPHRGVDWSRYHIDRLGLSRWWTFAAAGTITALKATDTGELGLIVEVRDTEGWYWTYCHSARLAAGLAVGTTVTLRQVGGLMGASGSAASAGSEHLHLALSNTAGGGVSGAVVDPVAHIKARLAPRRRKNMTTLYHFPKEGGTGNPIWALAGDAGAPCPGNWQLIRTQTRANALAAIHGSAVTLASWPEWESHAAFYTTPTPVTVQSDPALLAAIEALPEANAAAFFAEQKKPGN